MTALPEGWLETTLDDIANWGSGGTPSRKNASYYNGEIPWVKTGDLGDKVITQSSEYITEEAVRNSSAKFFPKGSVAIAMYGATIGKTSILGIEATTNQACGVGQPIQDVTTTDFLYYLLINEKDRFIAKGKGGAQPNISQTIIKSHVVQLPPFAEQKQIATKLDELLAQVDIIKTRLDAIPTILKRFRQSVLAAAVSGKLTELWRGENDKPEFTLKKLGEHIELAYGKSLPDKKRTGEGFPVFGSNGIVGNHKDFLLEGPFIIVGRKGSFGVVTWSEESGWPIDTTYYVVIKNNDLELKYAFYMLQTLGLQALNRSTAIPGLNRDDAYACSFLLPSIAEQAEIVQRIEQFFNFADKIEMQVKSAQARINNLTQSILAKAFRGELTAEWREQNPDLISGENSADVLLEKIKIMRAVTAKKKKPVRRKIKKKSDNTMKPKNIIPVVEALKSARKPLTSQQLLAESGYPGDASIEQLEIFFLDIRKQVDLGVVARERRGDEELLSLVD